MVKIGAELPNLSQK